MRMKKLTRSKKPRRWNEDMHVVQPLRGMSERTMVVASACALGAVMLLGAAASGTLTEQTRPSVPPAPVRTASFSTLAPAPRPVENAIPTRAETETTPAVDVKAPAPKVAAVTITGCLEKDDQAFRLKAARV